MSIKSERKSMHGYRWGPSTGTFATECISLTQPGIFLLMPSSWICESIQQAEASPTYPLLIVTLTCHRQPREAWQHTHQIIWMPLMPGNSCRGVSSFRDVWGSYCRAQCHWKVQDFRCAIDICSIRLCTETLECQLSSNLSRCLMSFKMPQMPKVRVCSRC